MKKEYLPPAAGVLCAAAAGVYYAVLVRDIALETGDRLPLKLYGLLLAAVFFGMSAAFFLLFRKRCPVHRFYFGAGLFLGVLFMCVMPGLSAPDEMSHYLTAYRLSSRMTGQPDLMPASGLAAVRADDYPLEDLSGVKTPEIADDEEPAAEILGNPVTYSTFRTIADWDRRYPHREGTVSSGLADVRTTPVMYLPQSAGMAAVRMAGGSALQLLFAGRFMNLLVFLLLSAAAVRLMPFGKEALAGVGLLPMTLHLAASLSYDAGILGCSFLLTAEILRLAYGTKERSKEEKSGNGAAVTVKPRDMVLPAVLTAALSPCKMVYSCLVLLFLLIPAERFGSAGEGNRRRKQQAAKLLGFFLLLAVSMLSIAAVNASVIRGYAAASRAEESMAGTLSGTTGQLITEGAVVTSEGEVLRSGYTASELIRRPFFIFRMVCGTFSSRSGEMFGDMLGMRLGNLDPLLGIPFFLALLLFLGLVLLSLKRDGAEQEEAAAAYPGLRDRLLIAAAAVLVMLLTAGAMLLSWTTRDSAIIEGIQGRYFLPVLPLFLLLLRNGTVVLKRNPAREILFAFFCMDAFALLRIFTLACMRL